MSNNLSSSFANNLSSSFGEHSRLDWGADSSLRCGSSTGNSDSVDTGAAMIHSRYDPRTVSKVVDITDLVDDDSDASDDEDIIGHSSQGGTLSVLTKSGSHSNVTSATKQYGPGGSGPLPLVAKQVLFLLALLGVIIGACVAIGYAVLESREAIVVSPPSSGESNNELLLQTAERVITACAELQLNQDMSECQNLCHSKMCCFDSGKYSCEKDENKACAVFAGCEALVDGALLYEDELDQD